MILSFSSSAKISSKNSESDVVLITTSVPEGKSPPMMVKVIVFGPPPAGVSIVTSVVLVVGSNSDTSLTSVMMRLKSAETGLLPGRLESVAETLTA